MELAADTLAGDRHKSARAVNYADGVAVFSRVAGCCRSDGGSPMTRPSRAIGGLWQLRAAINVNGSAGHVVVAQREQDRGRHFVDAAGALDRDVASGVF